MSARRRARLAVSVLSAALLSAGPAFAQALAQGAATPIAWWRIFAVLLLCLLLAVAAAVALHFRATGRLPNLNLKNARITLPAGRSGALQQLFGSASERRLKAVETIRVSPYADVCLFICDGKTYLIAATPQGVTVIDRDAAAPADGEAP